MKRLTIAIIIIAASILTAAPSWAGEKEWLDLTDRAIDAYRHGRREEAVEVARKALAAGEETFGKDSQKIVGSLDDLAAYLQALGKYDESEALYRRALAILEKTLPPDDSFLAIFMNYLAGFYEKIGKHDEAARLTGRAVEIRALRAKNAAKTKEE